MKKAIVILMALLIVTIPSNQIRAEEKIQEYEKFYSTIKNIDNDGDNVKLFVKNNEKDDEYYLKVKKETKIFDKNLNEVKLSGLKEGQNIVSYFRIDQPITLIYPPEYPVDLIVVDNEENQTLEFGRYKKNKIEDRLYINSLKDTKIFNESRQIVDSKEVENKLVLVKYNAATRSIPPQTNPEEILIIENQKINLLGENLLIKSKDFKEDGFLPLRKVFEDNGYKVIWEEDTSNIIISKQDLLLKIDTKNRKSLDSDETLDIYIDKGRTYIK
ncbi:MAG: hypothetical protein ACTHWZ_04465 [Peptoniphilaceae bacterium]